MALKPENQQHALQIQAGIFGRKAGHEFEKNLTAKLNSLPMPFKVGNLPNFNQHLFMEKPEIAIINYISLREKIFELEKITALSTGVLATSEDGKRWLRINDIEVGRSKSDVILTLKTKIKEITVGISTKQCNKKSPTNAQIFFGTAFSFCKMLRENGIAVSQFGENALRQFCGDKNFCPLDFPEKLIGRTSDPRRFFWEEIEPRGKDELEKIFTKNQIKITRLLLQKAYFDDSFAPNYVLHKTKKADNWEQTEVAIYSIEELIKLSKDYKGFHFKPYSVRKGKFRDVEGVTHLAPRFGIIQMQRGGQKQHPTQLQFNLEAGYFYKI